MIRCQQCGEKKPEIQIYGITRYKCQIHLDEGCAGSYVTRRSFWGARVRGCMKAWTVPLVFEDGGQATPRIVKIDLELGWPEVIKTEEL